MTADDREARLRALLSVDVGPAAPDADAPEVARERPTRAPEPPAGPEPPTAPPEREPEPLPEPAPLGPAPERRTTGLRTVLSTVLLLGLFAAGAGLFYAGTRIIRSSTEGEMVVPVSEPDEPGYEALVDATPTMVVIHDLDGEVDALTVLTLPDPAGGGGGVIMVPTRIVDDLPVFELAPIEAAYDLGSAQFEAEVVGDLLTVAMGEFVVVDAERWAGLVAPVAPLVVDNPDRLTIDGEVRFPVGEIELDAEDVGPFLEARVAGESELARAFRHQVLWRAWLDAVADAGGGQAVPGELESGIGRFVRTLAAGPVTLETVPVTPTVTPGFDDEPTYRADRDAIAAVVADLVPFPRSPRPGVRPRVRVLNGTDDLEAAAAVARLLPPAGVEVVLVGNAATFDVDTTTIAVFGAEFAEQAEAVREVLGVGRVVEDVAPSDAADITVTLGADHD